MTENILDSFLKTPRIYGVKVSPDLKWVIFSQANVGPTSDVYIVSIDKNDVPKKITNFNRNTSTVSWAGDSRSFIVGHDYDGDERVRLYKVNVDTAEIIALTEENPNYFLRHGEIDQNNKYLIYSANYDFEKEEEIERTYVYRQDLETGEKIVLAKPQKPGFVYPELNEQGTHIIYQRNDRDAEGEQIWMVDIDGKEDKEIINFGDKVKVSASWHPNGKDIVFISEADNYRKVGLFNYENNSTKWLIDDSSRNIEEAYVPRGSKFVVINEIINSQNNITLLDIDSLEEILFSDFKTTLPCAQLPNGTWLSMYYNSKQPADLILHDKTKIINSVTKVFDRVDYTQDDLVKAENYTWNSVDGLKIQGWIYRSKIKSVGTIVLVHGGPTHHSEDAYDVDIQYFVSQGFNVLDPNYRGSTGFGLEFQESIKKEGWGGKEQDDILEGVKSLVKDGTAESGKIGITGTSYGGYSSWFAITHFAKEFISASIPICGMTDLVVDYNTTRPDLRGYSEEMMGGTPLQVPERYHNGSPINFIQNIVGKLLIVQGAKDPNVSPENVRAVEEELKKHNINYEKLVFDDEGHGISKPKNQKMLLVKSVEFFKKAFGLQS